MSLIKNPVFCALDTGDLAKAQKIAKSLRGHVRGFKLGLEFFLAHGVTGYQKLSQYGTPIFLDLKLHDIPNTVAGAVRSLIHLRPAFLTLHASGGEAMMRAAVDVFLTTAHEERPKLLGVTVLTSLDTKDLNAVGQGSDMNQQTLRLAKLAQECGMDGIVCSSSEVRMLRDVLGPKFILMVPGIRPAWVMDKDDQKRTMHPREAMAAGATYLVIGRPITDTENPGETAKRIVTEVA